jgi:hypothetical protein
MCAGPAWILAISDAENVAPRKQKLGQADSDESDARFGLTHDIKIFLSERMILLSGTSLRVG